MTMTEIEDYENTRTWTLCDTTSGDCVEFRGRLLGYGASRRDEHSHRGALERGKHCHACRWFEVEIIRCDAEYVVVSYGRTSIEGEVDRTTIYRTQSPYAVVEFLTTQNPKDNTPFIPRTSRLALAEAAGRDTGIEQAWVDRAV